MQNFNEIKSKKGVTLCRDGLLYVSLIKLTRKVAIKVQCHKVLRNISPFFVHCLLIWIHSMLVKAPQNESCSWEMYRAYYLQWESSPWSSGTLHHFLFEMYGTFKKGKRSFPLTHGAPKWTNSYLAVDEAELKEYVSTLFELLVSDKRKFLPRSWWSVEVVSMLLGLYFQYNAQ